MGQYSIGAFVSNAGDDGLQDIALGVLFNDQISAGGQINALQLRTYFTYTYGGNGGGYGLNHWDSVSPNWCLVGQSGSVAYTDGSSSAAVFDDTGINRNITIQTQGVSPGFIAFNNTVPTDPYTFTGGAIATPLLTVSGAGAVNFNNTAPSTVTSFAQTAGITTFGAGTNYTLTTAAFNGGTANLNGAISIPSCTIGAAGTVNLAGPLSTNALTNNGVLNVNYGGAALDLSGVSLTNNGTINGSINVYSGSTAQGSGVCHGLVSVYAGGRVSPGNSPGTFTSDAAQFNPGGIYTFEIQGCHGSSGVGMDYWIVTGGLDIEAGTGSSCFIIEVDSLDPLLGASGLATNFDPTQRYDWTLVHTGTGITGLAPTSSPSIRRDSSTRSPGYLP